jgi:hypothetical protein
VLVFLSKSLSNEIKNVYLQAKICGKPQKKASKMVIHREKYLQQLIAAKGNGIRGRFSDSKCVPKHGIPLHIIYEQRLQSEVTVAADVVL